MRNTAMSIRAGGVEHALDRRPVGDNNVIGILNLHTQLFGRHPDRDHRFQIARMYDKIDVITLTLEMWVYAWI